MGAEQEQVVLNFLEFTRGQQIDVDGMVGLLSEDISYEVFVPSPPRVGRDAVRAELERQKRDRGLNPARQRDPQHRLKRSRCLHRTYRSHRDGGTPLRLHINGVFEVDGGKIGAWREYYDTGDVASQLGIDVHDIVRWMELPTR